MPAGHDEDAVKLLPVADGVNAAAAGAASAAAMHMKQLPSAVHRSTPRHDSNPWLSICEHCNCWQLHRRQLAAAHMHTYVFMLQSPRFQSPCERGSVIRQSVRLSVGPQLLLFFVAIGLQI